MESQLGLRLVDARFPRGLHLRWRQCRRLRGGIGAEAHGSFAAGASDPSVNRQAKLKYARQVKPYIATISPFGKVIHGYSVAFGSAPGTAGGFLSLSETKITKRRGVRGVPTPATEIGGRPDGTPTPIVLASHRSNFLLMGAADIVDWIDWIRSGDGAAPEPEPIEFIRLQYAGRNYLASAPWSWRSDFPLGGKKISLGILGGGATYQAHAEG